MSEMEDEQDEFLTCELFVQFLLKGRDDPLICLLTIQVHTSYVEHHTVHDLMEVAESMILNEIDTVGTFRLVFTDSNHNKHIIIMSEIQAVSVLSPEKMPGA